MKKCNRYLCFFYGILGAALLCSVVTLVEWYPHRVLFDLKQGDVLEEKMGSGGNYYFIVTKDVKIIANEFDPIDRSRPLVKVQAVKLIYDMRNTIGVVAVGENLLSTTYYIRVDTLKVIAHMDIF